jgi:hypothetical protein
MKNFDPPLYVGSIFTIEYIGEFETEIENILGC